MHLCWDGQIYLEELVKQKGEPVGKHLLSHRLRPGGGEEGGETVSENRKSQKSDSACVEKKTVGLGGIYDQRSRFYQSYK